ncbi:MAG: hypothetical protein AAF802_25380 [Planctomycetota bacterium]
MIAPIVPYVLALFVFGTYVLQLITGVAVIGWAGDKTTVDRRRQPRQYWFVMLLQTSILVAGLLVFR